MATADWIIVGLYLFAALGIGIFFTRRASRNTADFFVAGRSLPWYIAGTSMVATTFSSDTPLFVAGMTRNEGIYANWFWWGSAIGMMASVFFFARLWRRTNAVTEIEFIALRYEPSQATSILRILNAIFYGVFKNCVIMASVTLAMSKVLDIILDLPKEALFSVPLFGPVTSSTMILLLLGLTAVLYTTLSGLYGVVYTDLIQFALAMIGSIALAVIVYIDVSSGNGWSNGFENAPDLKIDSFNFFPDFGEFDWKVFTFLVVVGLQWWSVAPGQGYFVQRMLATRSERDAMLSVFWFSICHYVIRSWPWLIVGLASMIYFPGLADAETAYPKMIDQFLPIGLKGIMVASLLAAFMSTLDTHMNWGSSYLINDVYQPYMAKGRDPHHYVKAARVCMVLLTVLALIVSTNLTGILVAYKYIFVIISGVSLLLIVRWYWWKVNTWSEISALTTALVVGNVLTFLIPDQNGEDLFALRLVINLTVTSATWIIVTLLTTKEPTLQCKEFYRKTRVNGIGWKRIAEETGVTPKPDGLKNAFAGWIASIIFLYSLLLGFGYLLFSQWPLLLLCGFLTVISGAVVWNSINKFHFD